VNTYLGGGPHRAFLNRGNDQELKIMNRNKEQQTLRYLGSGASREVYGELIGGMSRAGVAVRIRLHGRAGSRVDPRMWK